MVGMDGYVEVGVLQVDGGGPSTCLQGLKDGGQAFHTEVFGFCVEVQWSQIDDRPPFTRLLWSQKKMLL